jgi:hypothetical protein
VAVRSKAWLCGCPLAGIVGSQPPGGRQGILSLVIVVCCQMEVSLSDDHSSREVLPNVVCLEYDFEISTMRCPWPTEGRGGGTENQQYSGHNRLLSLV